MGFKGSLGRGLPTGAQPMHEDGHRQGAVISGFGDDDEAGYSRPQDKELHVYIQPRVIFLGPNYVPGSFTVGDDYGSDSADGLMHGNTIDSIRPLESLDGLYRQYDRAAEGYTGIVHHMGAGGDDPVDSPAEGRILFTRHVKVGIAESWRSNYIYRGPRDMFIYSGSAVQVTSVSESNGRALIQCNGAIGPATYFARWMHQSGREMMFPMPVSENHASGTAFYTEFTDPTFLAAVLALGQGASISNVSPAVWIAADGTDSRFNGVHVVGQGAFRVGDRVAAEAPLFDANPNPVFERLTFGQSTWDVAGSYWVDNCRLADKCWVRGGEPRFRNCVTEGPFRSQGGGAYMTQSSQLSAANDAAGRMLEYDEDVALSLHPTQATADPHYPCVGMDLCVTGPAGCNFALGQDVGGRGGTFRILKGLSIINASNGIGAKIMGPDSCLWQHDQARLNIRCSDTSHTGIWCVDGGRARIVTSLTNITGTSNDLRVGKGAAISLGTSSGQFTDAATWNGNFTRRHELTSSYPTDDTSRIWASSWEPVGYWEGS